MSKDAPTAYLLGCYSSLLTTKPISDESLVFHDTVGVDCKFQQSDVVRCHPKARRLGSTRNAMLMMVNGRKMIERFGEALCCVFLPDMDRIRLPSKVVNSDIFLQTRYNPRDVIRRRLLFCMTTILSRLHIITNMIYCCEYLSRSIYNSCVQRYFLSWAISPDRGINL